MEIIEAIRSRQSTRQFLPVIIPQNILRSILEVALWAPSWGNSQPWEFVIATGNVLQQIKKRYQEAIRLGIKPNPEVPRPTAWPQNLQERMSSRRQAMYALAELDSPKEQEEFRHHVILLAGAPQAIFVCMERCLGEWSMFDLGGICQTIMLAAQAYELDTCLAVSFVYYPKILHEVLQIPETKKVVIGIAIGKRDPEAQINSFRSSRIPLDEVARWCDY